VEELVELRKVSDMIADMVGLSHAITLDKRIDG
jgi:hypothetical protein